MEAFAKWAKTPEAKKAMEAAKCKAWKNFLAKFSNADKSKFEAQVYFEKDHTGKGEIYFKKGQGFFTSVFGSDSKYWSPEMKAALGKPSAFPPQLTPMGGSSLPIPAVSFGSAAPSLKKIFNNSIDIYATPDQCFTTKFREIFQKTRLTHHSGKESKKWLGGANMSYWPQQLNFAVWCATTGYGILHEIFDKVHSTLGFPTQVYSFYQFHVYFTVRRILYQLGGIQSISALPGDPTLKSGKQQVRRGFIQEDLRRVWNKSIKRFSLNKRRKPRPWKRLHLCFIQRPRKNRI